MMNMYIIPSRYDNDIKPFQCNLKSYASRPTLNEYVMIFWSGTFITGILVLSSVKKIIYECQKFASLVQ